MTTPQASTSLSEAGLLIVGIARNCEKDLQGDVKRLLEALKCRGKLSWFLVESDSSDKTFEVLASLESELPDFRFRSSEILPARFLTGPIASPIAVTFILTNSTPIRSTLRSSLSWSPISMASTIS